MRAMTIAQPDSPAAVSYLDRLNPAQRRAVEHGGGRAAGPLLIIAGAGSGKTSTLAHRVAHLIVNGADPRRILLLTFSRRAAAEMIARVERIAGSALGARAAALADGLAWAGTFHAIGARLLREHALDDRARPRLHHPRPRGFGRPDEPRAPRARAVQNREPVPDQGHLPGDLFARRQRAGAARRGARQALSLVRRLERANCVDCSPPMSRPSRRQNVLDYDDLLLYWAQMAGRARTSPQRSASASTISWSTNTRTPTACRPAILLALKPDGRGAHRGRRRRAVDLLLPRRRPCATSSTSPATSRRRPRSSRSSATTARPSRSSRPPTR